MVRCRVTTSKDAFHCLLLGGASVCESGKRMSEVEIRPRNSLVPVALVPVPLSPVALVPVALVTLQEGSYRGYELTKRLAERGFEEKIPGTLYRTVGQMEQEGLCKTEWETSDNGGPGCRVYSITNEGEAYLGSWAERGGNSTRQV